MDIASEYEQSQQSTVCRISLSLKRKNNLKKEDIASSGKDQLTPKNDDNTNKFKKENRADNKENNFNKYSEIGNENNNEDTSNDTLDNYDTSHLDGSIHRSKQDTKIHPEKPNENTIKSTVYDVILNQSDHDSSINKTLYKVADNKLTLNRSDEEYKRHSEIANENKKQDTVNDTPDPNLSLSYNAQDIHSSIFNVDRNDDCIILMDKQSFISVSSKEVYENNVTKESLDDTIIYEKPFYSVSFALTDCNKVDMTTKNVSITRMIVSHVQNDTKIDCEVIENSQESEKYNDLTKYNLKQTVSVNLEIKKKNLSTSEDQSKVLILNTNANEKLSHVIVQPPCYKSFRRKIQGQTKASGGKQRKPVVRSARKKKIPVGGDKLKQNSIKNYFRSTKNQKVCAELCNENWESIELRHDDMSKTARTDTAASDGIGRLYRRVRREENDIKSFKMPHRDPTSQTRTNSEAPQIPSPRSKVESASSCSPRRNTDSLHFSLPSKTKSHKAAVAPRDIPRYKIVDGTHFAVDAFCYGDIPGVKNYFLTHFHTDHYSGLKKSFNKTLYCSQITADLCTSRLGVSAKCIRVINVDESLRVDGVEVTAIDANHCPGAVMLLFALPNGKTLLHTGDFRATPAMESHPAFWNNDIHTIYLDTTYCNPRYDFPTQDQSLEMALHILRQKKMALEKIGRKFASVLIVCGTYTIGKEKFFLGMARRVGCSVWACPEKERVLQAVEGRGSVRAAPHACQLHVVPMRDLTHEKLSSYLASVQGPFSEVVAFKPSGWEHGKTTPSIKDAVTIHGIPYSEHSSFPELVRFVTFLKPKQAVPTVDIPGGIKSVQKYFPCPLVDKEDIQCQSRITDYFNSQNRQQLAVVN